MINKTLDSFQETTKKVLSNGTVYTVLSVFFVLYGASIAPKPPVFVKVIFDHTLGKLLLVALASLTFNADFRLALLISVCFVLGSNIVSNRPISESFSEFKSDYKSNTTARLLQPKTNIHYGCINMKLADLVKAFDGDAVKMQKTLKYAFNELLKAQTTTDGKQRLLNTAYAAGLPYNVKIDDENAPYIATILIQWGYDLGGNCKLA